jgi:myo-inositol-1(or 4)-monophosphatase
LPDADRTFLAEDLALLVDAAESAADIALAYFRGDPQVWHKENASPVSEADYAVDRHLKEKLLAARPGYGWLSEETEDDLARLDRSRVFVVDPIDGTRGFLAGSDEWTISLAVVDEGRPVAAALIQPATARLYTAVAGGGAWVGSRPLALGAAPPLFGARVAGPAALITALRRQVGNVNPAGYIASLALRIAMVADGRLDLALAKPNAHDWDIAAADLVLAEAGGALAGLDGVPVVYNRPHPKHPALAAAHPDLAARTVSLIGNHPVLAFDPEKH